MDRKRGSKRLNRRTQRAKNGQKGGVRRGGTRSGSRAAVRPHSRQPHRNAAQQEWDRASALRLAGGRAQRVAKDPRRTPVKEDLMNWGQRHQWESTLAAQEKSLSQRRERPTGTVAEWAEDVADYNWEASAPARKRMAARGRGRRDAKHSSHGVADALNSRGDSGSKRSGAARGRQNPRQRPTLQRHREHSSHGVADALNRRGDSGTKRSGAASTRNQGIRRMPAATTGGRGIPAAGLRRRAAGGRSQAPTGRRGLATNNNFLSHIGGMRRKYKTVKKKKGKK